MALYMYVGKYTYTGRIMDRYGIVHVCITWSLGIGIRVGGRGGIYQGCGYIMH